MKKFVIVLFLTICIGGKLFGQKDTLKYFFEGHTYQWHTVGNKVDERLEKMDFSEYDGIWLGGDVCSEALMEYSTLEYIDSIFNLKHPNTHWAFGNHDAHHGNWIWVEELTGRKTYYTSFYKGISYMILNTTLTPYDCEKLNDQYRTIENLCDTIEHSSHLIFIIHHAVWTNVDGLLPILPSPYSYAQSNLKYYNFNCYDPESSFLKVIYPKLVEVKKRGVEVLLIMGDMGSQRIEFTSTDGIHFMGTGLNRSKFTDPVERENSPRDWYIEFKHVPDDKYLSWKFHDLDSTISVNDLAKN